MFDQSYPPALLLLLLLFCFVFLFFFVEISMRKLVPLFMPGSDHNGSAS